MKLKDAGTDYAIAQALDLSAITVRVWAQNGASTANPNQTVTFGSAAIVEH